MFFNKTCCIINVVFFYFTKVCLRIALKTVNMQNHFFYKFVYDTEKYQINKFFTENFLGFTKVNKQMLQFPSPDK